MQRTVDRRLARAWVALAAMVFAVIVATSSVADRVGSEDRLKMLVQFASASERLDARVTYRLERTVPSGKSLVAGFSTWQRVSPRLVVREDDASIVVDNDQMHIECREQSEGVVCTSSAARLPTADSARLYFVAVRVAGSYRVEERPDRRISGEHATCMRLIGTGRGPRIAALGDRLDLCFAADGALLMSDRVSAESHDRQIAERVQRGFDVKAYRRLLEKFRPTVGVGKPA